VPGYNHSLQHHPVLWVIQIVHSANQFVLPGLDPGIHGSATDAEVRVKDVDGRDKPGQARP
jgi:hypothetical protein